MGNVCARCKRQPAEHEGGQCPDGKGSYTWEVPPKKQLQANVMRIREVLARHGRSTEAADELVAALGRRIAEEEGTN